MDILYDSVKTIVIYLILVAIVMNLLGTSSYKKYVAMFTGMLLIYIVITPVMKLFNLTDSMDYHFEENYFKVEAKDMNTHIFNADDEQSSYIIDEYRVKLEHQIEEVLNRRDLTLKECELKLDEDMSSKTFGCVLGIYILGKKIQKENQVNDKNIIEEISIDKIKIEKDENQVKQEISKTDSVEEIEIKQELARFYNLDSKLIHVDIDYRE